MLSELAARLQSIDAARRFDTARAALACANSTPLHGCQAAMNAKERATLLKMREQLVCPLCNQLYVRPVSLPCAHVLCTLCARGALEGRGVYKSECPLCQQPAHGASRRRVRAKQLPRVRRPHPLLPVRDLISNTKFANIAELLQTFEEGGGWGAQGLDGEGAGLPPAAPPRPPQEAGGPAGGTETAGADTSPVPAYHELLRWTERQAQLGTPTESQLGGLEEDEAALRAGLRECEIRLQRVAEEEEPLRESRELLDSLPSSQLRKLCRHFKVSVARKASDARMRDSLARQPCDTLRAVLAVVD